METIFCVHSLVTLPYVQDLRGKRLQTTQMTKRLLVFLVMTTLAVSMTAQRLSGRGTVIDENNEAVIGAAV